MLKLVSFLLAPFALLYGLIVKIRNLLFDYGILKSISFKKPVICVGNITVGGTGKTPHVEYLLKILSTSFNVATLSRGYGRKTKGFGYVTPASTAVEVGDEPLQMKLKYPAVKVAVDADRVNGISTLIKENPDLDAIILDDAFQHRWVKAGLQILLIDFNRLITRDYFLPMGRLRDSVKEKRRADIVLITKCPLDLSQEQKVSIINELRLSQKQSVYFTGISYGEPQPVFQEFGLSLELIKNQDVFAFAGIANPISFFSHIKNRMNLVEAYTFPDHFSFSESKLSPIIEAFIKNKSLHKSMVTTEKDAARIRGLSNLDTEIKKALFFIPIEIEFVDNQENNFINQILTYARKN
ncbi:MAG: tetraacyldisaccharide 4'-kinase [Bacteroidales bacterium]|nr:MAG: tetraacyldisaccharide 4'-kinase [Bacteroidales bacterium]